MFVQKGHAHSSTNTLLTVFFGELFGLLIRHVPLSLQVGLVTNQNDHLHTNTHQELYWNHEAHHLRQRR